MSATNYNFNVATQNLLRTAITNLGLGYVATWSVVASECVLDLGTIFANRSIKLKFPKGGEPKLTVTAATEELRMLLTQWAQPALATVTAELKKWQTKGDVIE
jgi:hypothetical protein